MKNTVDADFLALPLTKTADAGLSEAKNAGASHVDIRIERVRTGYLQMRDANPETQSDDTVTGIGVRVIVNGAWGFASSPEISPEVAMRLARTAVAMAKTSKPLATELVSLATEPVYSNKTWVSDYELDPFAVSDEEKFARIGGLSSTLLKSASVTHVDAHTMFVKEQKFYADSY